MMIPTGGACAPCATSLHVRGGTKPPSPAGPGCPDGFVALALHQSEVQMCLLQKILQKEN